MSEASMLQSFAADDSDGKRLVTFEDAERGLNRRMTRMTTEILRVAQLDELTLLRNFAFSLLVLGSAEICRDKKNLRFFLDFLTFYFFWIFWLSGFRIF